MTPCDSLKGKRSIPHLIRMKITYIAVISKLFTVGAVVKKKKKCMLFSIFYSTEYELYLTRIAK